MKHLQDIEQEDEYRNRIFLYYIEIKNNQGLPTKFKGTQFEFEEKYFKSDTLGKVIDYTKEEYTEPIENPNIINDRYHPLYGRHISEIEEPMTRKNTNKRYWRYL